MQDQDFFQMEIILFWYMGIMEFFILHKNLKNKFINIVTKTTLDESPTISPNGHIIIYSTKKDEQGYLAGITVDKKSKFQLPVKLGSIREPAWSHFLN